MRKLVVLEARPGMILHTPVIDQDGQVALPAAHVLAEADLDVLSASGATEIEVDDHFAGPSRELFPPHIEAGALQALNAIILVHPGANEPLHAPSLEKLIVAIDELIDAAGPELAGRADFAGPDSLQGHDYVHPVKVAELAIVLARALGMHPTRVRELALAATLMNVGYASLRRSLLDEPRALEDHEWQHQVRLHPEYSCRMLAESGFAQGILDAIEQHHERWDGSGYPRALKGPEIGEYARIIAIADTYVSLRSRRAYRNAGSHADAIKLLEDGADELFDAELVRLFVDVTARVLHEEKRASSRSREIIAEAKAEDVAARRAEKTEASSLVHRAPSEHLADDEPEDENRRPASMAQANGRPRTRPVAVEVARTVAPSPIRELRMPPPAVTKPVRARRLGRRRRSLWSSALYLESARRGDWTGITSR